jgi:hypothetical protein
LEGEVVIDTAVHVEVTVTVTVKVLPTHIPAVGVTVYTAVPDPDGMVSVPLILDTPVDWATPPVTPPVYVGTGQV